MPHDMQHDIEEVQAHMSLLRATIEFARDYKHEFRDYLQSNQEVYGLVVPENGYDPDDVERDVHLMVHFFEHVFHAAMRHRVFTSVMESELFRTRLHPDQTVGFLNYEEYKSLTEFERAQRILQSEMTEAFGRMGITAIPITAETMPDVHDMLERLFLEDDEIDND